MKSKRKDAVKPRNKFNLHVLIHLLGTVSYAIYYQYPLSVSMIYDIHLFLQRTTLLLHDTTTTIDTTIDTTTHLFNDIRDTLKIQMGHGFLSSDTLLGNIDQHVHEEVHPYFIQFGEDGGEGEALGGEGGWGLLEEGLDVLHCFLVFTVYIER